METECTFYVELAEDVIASHIFLASLESRLFWRETEEGGLLIALCLGGLDEARRRRERETQTHLSDSLNALVTLTCKAPQRRRERRGGGKLAPVDLTVAGGQLIAAAASLHTERLLVGKLCQML